MILYMENVCTNFYYMSGGFKGGDSVLLCILLLIFIIYDLFVNSFFSDYVYHYYKCYFVYIALVRILK